MLIPNIYCYFAILICVSRKALSQLECFSCQGGFSTACADLTQLGSSELCEGNNAQCYESIKHFQRGAIRLVERRCWVPDNKSRTKDYCTSFNNPNGKLIHCKTCRTNNCNTHKVGTCGMVDSLKGLQYTDYHYVGNQTPE
ncbi:hypothetical protein HHI36_010312 [Cryptolaemus montrouzieri]|uniref:Sodefrin-like factor n=1 Tax=Cryptolaemus montrouzieri TaxID=559131 RepID=A0ABD2MJ50_9CUCU